jgi:hypothetical protein
VTLPTDPKGDDVKPTTQTKAELRAERDGWKKLAEEGLDPTLADLRLEGGALSMALAGPVVERIAVLFVEYFRGLVASNYIEFNIHDRREPFQRYTLTMQKVGALSPADKVGVAREALKRIANADRSMFASEEPINVARSALAQLNPPPPAEATTP